ncbi:MAG: hypothetical protein ACK559_25485 [bacterium]
MIAWRAAVGGQPHHWSGGCLGIQREAEGGGGGRSARHLHLAYQNRVRSFGCREARRPACPAIG